MYAPLRPTLALAILSALAACSDSTSLRPGGGNQLAFTTSSTAGTNAALAAVVPITKNGHTLDLTQVTLVVERAQLKRQNTDACTGDEDEHEAHWLGHESCAEVKIGPTLVDLPLTGGMVTLPTNVLPAGTYQEIEFRVTLARLIGTFDGNAFDVTIPVNAKSELTFATPLVVTDSTPTSITINVPIDTWLTSGEGALIDPRQLLTNSSLLASVKARIAASFHAFEDENHDGKEDHNRGGDRGQGN